MATPGVKNPGVAGFQAARRFQPEDPQQVEQATHGLHHQRMKEIQMVSLTD